MSLKLEPYLDLRHKLLEMELRQHLELIIRTDGDVDRLMRHLLPFVERKIRELSPDRQ